MSLDIDALREARDTVARRKEHESMKHYVRNTNDHICTIYGVDTYDERASLCSRLNEQAHQGSRDWVHGELSTPPSEPERTYHVDLGPSRSDYVNLLTLVVTATNGEKARLAALALAKQVAGTPNGGGQWEVKCVRSIA